LSRVQLFRGSGRWLGMTPTVHAQTSSSDLSKNPCASAAQCRAPDGTRRSDAAGAWIAADN
jgi:hypothetical protein